MTAFLVLAALFVLAGCGGGAPASGDTPAPAPAPADGGQASPEPAPEPPPRLKTEMATGGKGALIYLPPAVAEFNGFFDAQGIDIEVHDVKGGSDAAKALIGGTVDFASMALDHVVKAKAQGTDLVLVALYLRYSGMSLIVDTAHADTIKSPADLAGTTMGVTSLGSGSHLALNALLTKSGVNPNDVEVLAVGQGTMIAALEQGTIDGAMHADPYVTQLVEEGKAYILFDLAEPEGNEWLYGGEYPFSALVTRRDVIDNNPELVQRMVNAIYEANRHIATADGRALAEVLPAEFRPDMDLYVRSLEHSKLAISPDGMVTADAVATVIEVLRDSGGIDANADVAPADLIDMSFLQNAIGN